jgi:hypothetical protein
VVWSNQNIILFHGTHSIAAKGIRSECFRLDLCRSTTDFGPGIYTTTKRQQAVGWAIRAVENYRRRHRGIDVEPVVLQSAVSRLKLSRLSVLFFVRGHEDFWELVSRCRDGGDHAIDGSWYDVVGGPLSMWPTPALFKDSDQISFHTEKACKLLYNSIRW